MIVEPHAADERRGAMARLVYVCLEEDAWVGRAVGEGRDVSGGLSHTRVAGNKRVIRLDRTESETSEFALRHAPSPRPCRLWQRIFARRMITGQFTLGDPLCAGRAQGRRRDHPRWKRGQRNGRAQR